MDEALRVAIEKFGDAHFESIPARCGVDLTDNKIKIKYLSRWYLVSLPDAGITSLKEKSPVSKKEKLIILHYLTTEKGTPLSGKLIDFREVPAGNIYYPSFESRVHKSFLSSFGESPSLFVKAAAALGGERIDLGDMAFKFVVLPRIPLHFILHKGDEEFPPACKVLFDASIVDYLPTEDIGIICEDAVEEFAQKVR